MLVPFDTGLSGFKRATSALDLDYDLMGLSQNKAFDEDSFLIEHGTSMAAFDELPAHQPVKDGCMNITCRDGLDQGFGGQGNLLLEADAPIAELPETGFSLRNRSLTFHYPSNTIPLDLLNNLLDNKNLGPHPSIQDVNAPMNFDFND